MSRTTKDSRRRHFSQYWKEDRLAVEYESTSPRYPGSGYVWHYYVQLPTSKPKLRKEKDTEDHWMSTPSWWTKMTMIRPERRAAHLLEKKALRVLDIEDMDFPDLGKKPHCYYW